MKRKKIFYAIFLTTVVAISTFLLTHSYSSMYATGIGIIMLVLSGLWLLSLTIKDASIIDIFWGSGFVIVAWLYASLVGFELTGTRNWVFLGMITIWGLRLTLYLAIRNVGKGEDYRYVEMRKQGGKHFWWISFLRVFALQGFLIWMISAVYAPALSISGSLLPLDYVGILFWAIGLFFEAVGDAQLRIFKQNPANVGKVMDKGLWRYTRHPNYFGDAMVWWGFFMFGLCQWQGLVFVFCPLIMTLFLLKVSGVALLESKLKKTKPQYAEYIRKTPAFVPGLPKK
jgi:steroid 5-alpha reductase family enzyme